MPLTASTESNGSEQSSCAQGFSICAGQRVAATTLGARGRRFKSCQPDGQKMPADDGRKSRSAGIFVRLD
jgi:hypothetical protein